MDSKKCALIFNKPSSLITHYPVRFPFSYKRDEVFRVLLLLGVTLVVGFFFPSKIQFKFEYALGGEWKYEDLRSPMDFPIIKDEAQIQEERDAVKMNFHPYYHRNEIVLNAQLERVDSLISQFAQIDNNWVRSQRTHWREEANKAIRQVFYGGICNEKGWGSSPFVYLTEYGSTRLIPRESLRNSQSAGQKIDSILRAFDVVLPASVLGEWVVENVVFDASLSEYLLEENLLEINPYKGLVKEGDFIVAKGDVVNEETLQKLNSFKVQFSNEVLDYQSLRGVKVGQYLFVFLILFIFSIYLKHYQSVYFGQIKNLIFLALWVVLFSFVGGMVELNSQISAFMIPFCILPIVLRNFFNFYLSFLTLMAVLMIGSFITSMGYEFTILHMLAGFVALISSQETRYWSNFFITLLYIFITYTLGYIALTLVQTGSWVENDWRQLGWFSLNSFMTLIAYPLIPLSERLFRYTSSISLAELSDLNQPLLKELSVRAPGTFQHSLQVANLAEAAAAKIGANSLLVKVSALYHDIGKMKHPQYYIENQTGSNPHGGMDAITSASFIIEHVEEGVRLAKEAKLPIELIECIRTHHGTTKVEFFLDKALNVEKSKINVLDFQYPGPKPRTKEETILMLADSLEAASKSLKEYTHESIESLVDKIIELKISHRQLDMSDLTFNEIRKCSMVFKKMLRSIYHIRITYPE
jgi:cyclic-di-AMP phosphodiesterase PgpH